jgi:hypothetical protein
MFHDFNWRERDETTPVPLSFFYALCPSYVSGGDREINAGLYPSSLLN